MPVVVEVMIYTHVKLIYKYIHLYIYMYMCVV